MVIQRKRNFKKKNLKIKKPSNIFINALISILAVVCIFFVYHSIEDKIFPILSRTLRQSDEILTDS